ncbi:hypothetical protein [Acinetobacter towneri]|uniref:hypothetical protein n=1 Tax=Acinetobacter towneri TaxID=202956 RepID=UPI00257634B8|nr:hypothetical protein [Acinetobacter towneri]MDM1720565.1 hypothetical protein [Acinetobacter towneri]
MDIQRKCFEESNNVNPDWSFKFDEELQQYIALDSEMELQVDEFNELWDAFRAGWQAAKAQAVQEWISVDDEPPTPNKTFSDAVIAWDGICVRRIPLCLFNSASEVTHWMPIPQPPKAQEQTND